MRPVNNIIKFNKCHLLEEFRNRYREIIERWETQRKQSAMVGRMMDEDEVRSLDGFWDY